MGHDLARRLQEEILKVRDSARSYREAAPLLNLAPWDLVDTRWGSFQPRKLIKMAFCSVPEVRQLAKRMLAEKGYSEEAIQKAYESRTGDLITHDELKAAQKFLAARTQQTGPSGRMSAGIPLVYTHIALQLEVCDYPSSSLFVALTAAKPSLAEIRDALLRDLIGAFIDAAYFKEFTRALRRRARDLKAPVPVHPHGKFSLNPDIYPEKSELQDEELRKLGVPPLQWHAQWKFYGRGVRDIFDCQGSDDRLTVLVREAKEAERKDRIYAFLYDLTRLEDQEDLVVPETNLVAAAAAVASFRLIMAIISAANAAFIYAADDPGLSGQVTPIIQQICQLSHFTYLDAAERIGDTWHKLPEKTSQFRTDRETLGYGYHMTQLASMSDEGAWFRLERSDKRENCFLGAHGSAIWDCEAERMVFRFVTGDDDRVPTIRESSSDIHYLYC